MCLLIHFVVIQKSNKSHFWMNSLKGKVCLKGLSKKRSFWKYLNQSDEPTDADCRRNCNNEATASFPLSLRSSILGAISDFNVSSRLLKEIWVQVRRVQTSLFLCFLMSKVTHCVGCPVSGWLAVCIVSLWCILFEEIHGVSSVWPKLCFLSRLPFYLTPKMWVLSGVAYYSFKNSMSCLISWLMVHGWCATKELL